MVAIYSTFLQRAYDQLIHDVALQNLPVLFAIDRAGIVGADGPTHQGAFDISFLRCIPNMVIMTPSSENECRLMLQTGYQLGTPAAVRYPRGHSDGIEPVTATVQTIEIGKAKLKKKGEKVCILNFGTLGRFAEQAAETLGASYVDMRFVKPLDHDIISEMAATHDLLVTVEDNAIAGGAGSAVGEYLASSQQHVKTLALGLPRTLR